MNWKHCYSFSLSICLSVVVALGCGAVSAQAPGAPGGGTAAVTEQASLHPKEVYPQIVRLSLVQGDVRVAVGKQKGQPEMSPWVQAAANMPLESGFSVVTGKGRAEIEFEDASTMYLGENSALTFDDADDEGWGSDDGDGAAVGRGFAAFAADGAGRALQPGDADGWGPCSVWEPCGLQDQ